MEITNIKKLSFEELCSLHEKCIQRDFSENQNAIRPLKMVKKLAKKDLYIAYGAYNNNTLIAYATFYSLSKNPVVLLDYFAVEPQYRGTGVGSSFFKEIKGIVESEFSEAKIIAIKYEDPSFSKTEQEKQLKIKQKTFFIKNGANPSDSKIFAFGVNYNLLSLKLNHKNSDYPLGKSLYDSYLYGFNPFLRGLAKKCLNYKD